MHVGGMGIMRIAWIWGKSNNSRSYEDPRLSWERNRESLITQQKSIVEWVDEYNTHRETVIEHDQRFESPEYSFNKIHGGDLGEYGYISGITQIYEKLFTKEGGDDERWELESGSEL